MLRSAPFNIADIGRTHLVLERQSTRGSKIYLLRVETHIQGSSIFLYISRETEPWPLKVRNSTDLEFPFQQIVSPPAVFANRDKELTGMKEEDSGSSPYPIRKIPVGKTVDYSWDSPTDENKRLRLTANGIPLPSTVDMMAIGLQPPVKLAVRKLIRLSSKSLTSTAQIWSSGTYIISGCPGRWRISITGHLAIR